MPVRVITAPSAFPTTLTLVKKHLRIMHDREDLLIESYIRAATEYFERITGRSLITQTLKMSFDSFPCEDYFHLERGCPLQEVLSVEYYDSTNTLQTLDAENYGVVTESIPGKIFRSGVTWGEDDLHPTRPGAVEVTFVAGYGDDESDVPEDIKLALSMLIGDSYSNRENQQVSPGLVTIQTSFGTNLLLMGYKTSFFQFPSQQRV